MARKNLKQAVWNLKIAVCVPSTGTWNAHTAECISNMISCFDQAEYGGGTKEVRLFGVCSSILPDSRHRLVAQAHGWGATHMLFIDSDMIVPWDTIQAFLKHNVPVVAANCVRRRFPTYPTAYAKDKRYIYSREESTGLEEVDQVGCAVMMIDMRLFDHEKMDLPWFAFMPDPNNVPGSIGEDVYFCRKIKEAGLPIYIDHDVSKSVKHMGDLAYSMDHALTFEDHYIEQDKKYHHPVTIEDPNPKESMIFMPVEDTKQAENNMRSHYWNGVAITNKKIDAPDGWETTDNLDVVALYPGLKHYMITTDDFVPGLDWAKRMAQRCGPWDVFYGPDRVFDEKLPTHPCIGGELVKHVGSLFLENKWFWSNAWYDIGTELGTLKYFGDGWGDWQLKDRKVGENEGQAYIKWKDNEFEPLIKKLKARMEEYQAPAKKAA